MRLSVKVNFRILRHEPHPNLPVSALPGSLVVAPTADSLSPLEVLLSAVFLFVCLFKSRASYSLFPSSTSTRFVPIRSLLALLAHNVFLKFLRFVCSCHRLISVLTHHRVTALCAPLHRFRLFLGSSCDLVSRDKAPACLSKAGLCGSQFLKSNFFKRFLELLNYLNSNSFRCIPQF